MDSNPFRPTTIDEYIAHCPTKVQDVLRELRRVIAAAAPLAEETISYGMPAFRSGEILVYFAAFKNHIGFYPTASGVARFAPELDGFKTSKGAIQFPLGRSIPYDLVAEIVKYRVEECAAKAKTSRRKG